MNKNSDKIVGSVLKVTASEELDVTEDLVSSPTKSIAELLNEQENTPEEVDTAIQETEDEFEIQEQENEEPKRASP